MDTGSVVTCLNVSRQSIVSRNIRFPPKPYWQWKIENKLVLKNKAHWDKQTIKTLNVYAPDLRTRDGSQIISVMRDRAQINRVIRHSSVMRDFTTITQRVIFLWNFRDGWYHLKLEAETLKIQSYGTNFLPFFLVSRPLISSDQMIKACLLM